MIYVKPSHWAIVDTDDYSKVAQYNWYLHRKKNGAYARAAWKKNGKMEHIFLHRLVLGVSQEVDHKDRNGLNCQKNNLRLATTSQNAANRNKVSGKSSQYKGVGFLPKRKAWFARVKHEGVQIYLGQFKSEKEAAEKYNQRAREIFGEFACLNQI